MKNRNFFSGSFAFFLILISFPCLDEENFTLGDLMEAFYLAQSDQTFSDRINQLKQIAQHCTYCGNACGINRIQSEMGHCQASQLQVAIHQLHFHEEPGISGKNGSGTIFFSHCPLQCVYCQNFEISQQDRGSLHTPSQLADMMLDLQDQGAHNINLVSPTPFLWEIMQALHLAKQQGLTLPLVYNSGGFDSVEALQCLDGFINIYLPDMKYADPKLGEQYSHIQNYPQINRFAVQEMYRQVGNPLFDEQGLMQKGLIIRHLVLPNHLENSRHVLDWIAEELSLTAWVSLMSQYFPTYKSVHIPTLQRRLQAQEYDVVRAHFHHIGLHNGYLQDLSSASDHYVPDFQTDK